MEYQKLKPSSLATWHRVEIIEAANATLDEIGEQVSRSGATHLIIAEGDSWFDKYSPVPIVGTNLLFHLRTPEPCVILDVSTIGHVAAQMIAGWQAWRIERLLKEFSCDALLLSAGGNDLKNLVAAQIRAMPAGQKDTLRRASAFEDVIKGIVKDVTSWVRLVRSANQGRNESTPILTHGYDYLQPRSAKAEAIVGINLGLGPWLYPVAHEAGFSASEMRSLADALIDELNHQFQTEIARLENVVVLDHRGLLTPASPGDSARTQHWLDEIHPSPNGFDRLVRHRWDVALANALGYVLDGGQLEAADKGANESTALNDVPERVLQA